MTPYKPSIAHVGGSHKALQIVRGGNYRDIDQFFNAEAYWRASDRYAPHSMYTNAKRLDALNKKKATRHRASSRLLAKMLLKTKKPAPP